MCETLFYDVWNVWHLAVIDYNHQLYFDLYELMIVIFPYQWQLLIHINDSY